MVQLSRSPVFAVAALVAALAVTSSRAATVAVSDDSGTLGAFTLVNNGSGNFAVVLTFPDNGNQRLTRINGDPVSIAADFGTNLGITIVGPGLGPHDYVIDTGVFTKIFRSPSASTTNPFALLNYQLKTARAGAGVTAADLVLRGTVLSVTNTLVDVSPNTYDFTQMIGKDIFITLTGSFPSGGTFTDMFDFMSNSTSGQSIAGDVSTFSQGAAVPEPTSLALMGAGLGGVVFFRRRFGKRSRA